VYPRIDVDSELCEDDFSWNPSNRKPSKRKRSKYQLILDVAETFFSNVKCFTSVDHVLTKKYECVAKNKYKWK